MMLLGFTIPIVDFDVPIEILTLGLITGLTYGVLGLGLTLVYRTTRILNFAHGEIGALPAVLIPVLVINGGLAVLGRAPPRTRLRRRSRCADRAARHPAPVEGPTSDPAGGHHRRLAGPVGHQPRDPS